MNRTGRFRFRVRQTAPSSYSVRYESVPSNAIGVAVRPGLDVALPRTRMLGGPLVLHAKLKPRGSGTLRVQIWRGGRKLRARQFAGRARMRLSTRRVTDYLVRIIVTPKGSFRGRQQTFRSSVFVPYLARGARGQSVRVLERRLAQLRYALHGVDTYFSYDTADAVLAFQKVHGLARTGRVSPAFWRRLQTAHVPIARYRGGGRHVEVDKSRQVLFEVDRGRVVRVVHVSTGATGNTPVGRWHVYSKVPGFLPSGMFYSSFFVGAFAIHGYHSVPPTPRRTGACGSRCGSRQASSPRADYGETVYIYH